MDQVRTPIDIITFSSTLGHRGPFVIFDLPYGSSIQDDKFGVFLQTWRHYGVDNIFLIQFE